MTSGRAFIFVNGVRVNLPVVASLIQEGDTLIAADGGYRFIERIGRQPDLLIGDLDSLSPEEIERARAEGVDVRQYSVHKDETDLELAVNAALEAGCQVIRIVAALGGRLDMTLGNLFLLQQPALANLDARLEDGYDEVSLVRPTGSPIGIYGKAGDRVSLLPLGGLATGVRTEGLFYPLYDETLYPERTRGISNVMTGETASVSLRSGVLICIHSHHMEEEITK